MTKHETFHAAVKGDAKAVTEVIRQYTPLVHKIVNKYAFMAPKHSREDLVQEGLIGIVKAIKTFDLNQKVAPMTWIYPNVRHAIQGVARKENKNPKYPLSLEQSDWGGNLEDPSIYEVKDEKAAELVREIVLTGCGTLESKQAQIVCDRFGLLGKTAMRQGEVARKYGLSKQAVQSYLARFHRKVRTARPELVELI